MPDHQTSPVGEDAERAAFEAWHRSKFATRHSTGQPTRDMHNGIYAEQYGPEKQQLMWEAWLAARRTAPALDASGLPPLPAPQRFEPNGREPTAYSAEQVRQAQRDAYATGRKSLSESTAAFVATANKLRDKRDAEIADLRAQLARHGEGSVKDYGTTVDKSDAAPTQPKAQVGSIEDYAQFHILHGAWMGLLDYYQSDEAEQVAEAWRKFIDYIDAWAGSRAGDAVPGKAQWWLASVDQYGNATLVDGAHDDRAGVNKAAYLFDSLGLTNGRRLAVAKVELSEPEPSSKDVNMSAIQECNRARLAAAPAPGKQAGNDQDAAV